MTETRAISSKAAENVTVRTSTVVNGQDYRPLSYADGLERGGSHHPDRREDARDGSCAWWTTVR